MANIHGRYDQLAVGHVLGGLSSRQTAEFRNHLLGCPECRSRVAELHGIADDLAAAERDERSQVPVATELGVPPREDSGTPGPAASRIGIGHVTVAVLVVLALATAMAFWNLHLRTTAVAYRAVVTAQDDALARLATGVELAPTLAEGVRARVVGDGDTVTLTLTGLEPLGEGERLVAWFGGAPDPGAAPPRILAGPGELDTGSAAVSLERNGASTLQVTREVGTGHRLPQGEMVLSVELGPDGVG